MSETSPSEFSRMLGELRGGDRNVVHGLLPVVYRELREIAARHLRRERANHTLSATVLVHEAYLKLVDQRDIEWRNRAHFCAIAAQAMRQILVDYAKVRRAKKRGAGKPLVTFDEELMSAASQAGELVDLHEALERLQKMSERKAKVVEYRFFGGLTHTETAEVLGVSAATVRLDWRLARAWLSEELKRDA